MMDSHRTWLMVAAVLSPFGIGAGVMSITIAALLFKTLAPPRWKESVSLGPMGLRRRASRAAKPHGVLPLLIAHTTSTETERARTADAVPRHRAALEHQPEQGSEDTTSSSSSLGIRLQHWTEWARALPRSPRTTLLKQVQKARARVPYTIVTKPSIALSWSLVRVIYEHQRRYHGAVRAALACWGRCLVMAVMAGSVDEVRRVSDNRLIAVCQTVVKGSTLRAMWFYQDTEASQLMVWFAVLTMSVQRGIQMGCRFVDAGPSVRSNVADLKSKFGFTSTTRWTSHYDGPFRTPLPHSQLHLVTETAQSSTSSKAAASRTEPPYHNSTHRAERRKKKMKRERKHTRENDNDNGSGVRNKGIKKGDDEGGQEERVRQHASEGAKAVGAADQRQQPTASGPSVMRQRQARARVVATISSAT